MKTLAEMIGELSMMHSLDGGRRTAAAVGVVNWPVVDCIYPCEGESPDGSRACASGHRYRDTGEGGLEAWIVVPDCDTGIVHSVCNAGVRFGMTSYDVVVAPALGVHPFKPAHVSGGPRCERQRSAYRVEHHGSFSFVANVGSTGQSIWDMAAQDYFAVRREHLNEVGRALHDVLERVYGIRPTILTALDT